MEILLDALSWILIVGGGFLCVVGTYGMLVFPDFFSRMHAASVTDTGGIGLMVLGMLLQSGANQVGLKLILMLLFLLFTSPVATHALAKAALHGNLQPWTRPKAPGQADGAGGPDDEGDSPSKP